MNVSHASARTPVPKALSLKERIAAEQRDVPVAGIAPAEWKDLGVDDFREIDA